MALPTKNILPQPSLNWLMGQGRQDLAQYLAQLDALIGALASGNLGTLINAANDTAAKRAGVQIGQIYRNGSQLNVRVT